MSKQDDTINTAVTIGIVGIGILLFFMFKDKIAAYLQLSKGQLDLGLAPPTDTPAVPLGDGSPPPKTEEEQFQDEEYYPVIDVIRYYAQRVAEELDRYQGDRITRSRKLDIEAYALKHHKSDLQKIARLQNNMIKPLGGKAKAKFSELVLQIASKVGIQRLPSNVRKNLRAAIGHGDAGYTTPTSDYIEMTTRMRPA